MTWRTRMISAALALSSAFRVVNQGPQPGAEAIERELGVRACLPRLAHSAAPWFVEKQRRDRIRHPGTVGLIDQPPGEAVDDDFRCGVLCRTHTGKPMRHGLQIHQPEPLAAAWQGEQRRLFVQSLPHGLGYEAEKM